MNEKIKQLEQTIEKQEERLFNLDSRLSEMDRKLSFFEHWLSKMQRKKEGSGLKLKCEKHGIQFAMATIGGSIICKKCIEENVNNK